MRNSRARMMPLLARSSLRNFVWNWYTYFGRPLYEWMYSAMTAESGSSCVVASPSSPPFFSFVLNHTSMTSSRHRPVFVHGSGLWRAVNAPSCPPMAFISSRITCTMLLRTRRPSGKKEYPPAISLWMNPPRMRSCAFFATSSFGASRRVLVKSWDCLIGRIVSPETRFAKQSAARAISTILHDRAGSLISGKEARDVVERDAYHQKDDESDAERVHHMEREPRRAPAHRRLDPEEEQAASVESRYRHEIYDGKIDRDERREREEVAHAASRGVSHDADEADRADDPGEARLPRDDALRDGEQAPRDGAERV